MNGGSLQSTSGGAAGSVVEAPTRHNEKPHHDYADPFLEGIFSLTGASSSARNCLVLLSARRERHAQRVRVTPAGVLSIV